MNRTIKKDIYCLYIYIHNIQICALLIFFFFNFFLHPVRPKFKERNMKSFVVVKSGNTVRLNINFEVL